MTPFTWNVTLANAQNGVTHTRTIRANWSPDHELTLESVELAARDEAKREDGQDYLPMSVEQVVA